jgi:hypothetical protein
MIPSFSYIKLPAVLKKILKRNLRDSLHDEMYISQELSKDPALKLLLLRYFHNKVPDQTLQGLFRYHGWDYLRKLIISIYIYRIAYNQWPTTQTVPFVDGPFNFLEEELSSFTIRGTYRNSLLAFYLRLQELKLYQEHKVNSFKLIESCSRVVESLSILNIRGAEIDIAALQAWHLGEYYSWDILMNKIKVKSSYSDMMSELSLSYKKALTSNIATYLLSIGDEESFGLDKTV